MALQRLSDDELMMVSGGTGNASNCTVRAVGNPNMMPCRQEKCLRCGSTALTDGLFSTDNGRTVYQGQECVYGNIMIYGDNIM